MPSSPDASRKLPSRAAGLEGGQSSQAAGRVWASFFTN